MVRIFALVVAVVSVGFVACSSRPATTPPYPPPLPPPPSGCIEPPGYPIRWAAVLCEYKAQTDDFESEAVTACMATQPPKRLAHVSECEQKRYYKAEICKIVKPGDAACVDDASFVPDLVTHGVGGDD